MAVVSLKSLVGISTEWKSSLRISGMEASPQWNAIVETILYQFVFPDVNRTYCSKSKQNIYLLRDRLPVVGVPKPCHGIASAKPQRASQGRSYWGSAAVSTSVCQPPTDAFTTSFAQWCHSSRCSFWMEILTPCKIMPSYKHCWETVIFQYWGSKVDIRGDS